MFGTEIPVDRWIIVMEQPWAESGWTTYAALDQKRILLIASTADGYSTIVYTMRIFQFLVLAVRTTNMVL